MTRRGGSRRAPDCGRDRRRTDPNANSSSTRRASTAADCWCGWPESATASAADTLRGTVFVVDTEELPPIDDPDEFYDHQLEGLRVLTTSGTPVGTVAEVLHTAAGELLSVRSEDR